MTVPRPNSAAASASVATGPTQTSSPSKSSSQAASGRCAKTAASSAASSSCAPATRCRSASSGRSISSQRRTKNFGSSAPDGELPTVGRLVDPVAGEPAGEEPRQRVAAEPVRDQAMRAVRHRDRQAGAVPGALPLEQRSQDLRDGAEGAGREVGRLERRQGGSCVLEHARPAEVVEVVPGSRGVLPLGAEARDRAVDGGGGRVVRPDTEAGGNTGPEPLEHDVRLAPAAPARAPAPLSGRRPPTPCRRSAPRPRPARRGASDRPPAARLAPPGLPVAAARATRTRRGDTWSGRRPAFRPVAPPPMNVLQSVDVD